MALRTLGRVLPARAAPQAARGAVAARMVARARPALSAPLLPSRETSLPRALASASRASVSCSLGAPLRARAARARAAATRTTAGAAVTAHPSVQEYSSPAAWLHFVASMTAFFALDRVLLAAASAAGGWALPPPLLGMFLIISVLAAVEARFGTPAVSAVEAAAAPAVEWIGRWLPLFYVPSLVCLPLALRALPTSLLLKVVALLCAGWVASLLFAALVTVGVRAVTATELQPAPPMPAVRGFTRAHRAAWAAALGCSGLALQLAPVEALPAVAAAFMLSATVVGFLLGSALPPRAQRLLHPLLACAAVANAAAAAAGAARDGALGGYAPVLQAYLTKGAGEAGAGDFLMAFLHPVILSFGFRVFAQRALMRRHLAEIGGAVLSSAAFSLLATAAAGAAIGLPSALSLALAPRSVTVALALPIAGMLGASQWASVTATAVMFTGLLGANFAQPLLSALGFRDPVVRGLATAASAHGLGTAALAAKEPEALPMAALAYAALGVVSSLLVTVSQFRACMQLLAGA